MADLLLSMLYDSMVHYRSGKGTVRPTSDPGVGPHRRRGVSVARTARALLIPR